MTKRGKLLTFSYEPPDTCWQVGVKTLRGWQLKGTFDDIADAGEFAEQFLADGFDVILEEVEI